MPEEEKSLADVLGDAFDASEAAAGGDNVQDTDAQSAGSPEQSSDGQNSESEALAAVGESEDSSATQSSDAPIQGDEASQQAEASGQSAESGAQGGDASEDENSAPPVGLSAEAREAWADTPKAVRDAVAKREVDFARGIQQYAEAAKMAQSIGQVMQPYAQYIQMNGGPTQTLNTLLATGASLQMGSPQQKVQAVHALIHQFGVDIKMLDDMLVANPGAPQQPQGQQPQGQQPTVQQQIDSALDARDQQQQQQTSLNEVNAFAADPKNEFYQDVRNVMADLLDLAASRNERMTLQEAYDKACKMNDSVSRVIASRASAEQVSQRRVAASSVSGAPGGAPAASGGATDRRSALSDAFDTVQRRQSGGI